MARASYLQNDPFCFKGAQIPQQGPEGTRGDTLTQDQRKGAFFQLTVVGTNGSDGQVYSALKGDIPGVQGEVARKFAVAVGASSAEIPEPLLVRRTTTTRMRKRPLATLSHRAY